jgi:hypothetical protein
MEAFISSGSSLARNNLSVKTIAVSQALETTIGRAIASISRIPPCLCGDLVLFFIAVKPFQKNQDVPVPKNVPT